MRFKLIMIAVLLVITPVVGETDNLTITKAPSVIEAYFVSVDNEITEVYEAHLDPDTAEIWGGVRIEEPTNFWLTWNIYYETDVIGVTEMWEMEYWSSDVSLTVSISDLLKQSGNLTAMLENPEYTFNEENYLLYEIFGSFTTDFRDAPITTEPARLRVYQSGDDDPAAFLLPSPSIFIPLILIALIRKREYA